MDVSFPTGSQIESVDFSVLSPKEIKRCSVKQITSPDVFDALGHPVPGGLYDLSLGAFLGNICATCGLDERFCPGHMGHIDLPVPIYNPLFFSQMYVLLRGTCVYCHNFKMPQLSVYQYECKLRLIQYGLLPELTELESIIADKSSSNTAGDESTSSNIDTKAACENFINRSITTAIAEGRTTTSGLNTSIIQEERKKLVRQFYREIVLKTACSNCGMINPKFRKDGFSKIFELGLSDKDFKNNSAKAITRKRTVQKQEPKKGAIQLPQRSLNQTRYLLSNEVLELLNSLFVRESSMCKVLFHSRPDDNEPISGEMFFLRKLVVPPTRFRLPSKVGDQVHTNPKNDLLSGIISHALRIRDLSQRMNTMKADGVSSQDRKQVFSQLMNSLVTVQNEVNAFLDSTKSQVRTGKVLPGVKQTLEKKEGLFRKNMMGKRVNYAARSVISPDPNIETNEIGIPPVFAINLTYPEPVTPINFQEMRNAVINGPTKWPGATAIEDESGQLVKLANMSVEERTALANQLLTPSVKRSVINKKVYRHIRNQDIVLMNRQPTLHKASMMGHKVRVLPGEKTLRLHYANTGAYNADFDGDEMNMHFPQNEAARAEAMLLANTDSQYLTPTSGKPLRGLIQDHISAGVILTSKDTFFTKDKYQQLIYGCLRPEDGHTTGQRIITVPPTIFKPVPLWTGKQVINTVLLNIKPQGTPGLNLKSKNKIKNEYWGEGSTENDVIFKNGELVCGILDKSQYGAADHGLVHSVFEIYGNHTAGQLLSVLGRLFTRYITSVSFTCGMDDLHLTAEGDAWRRDILRNASDVGRKAAAEVTNLDENVKEDDPEFLRRLEEILRDDQKLAILDAITQSKVNAVATSVVSKCVPGGTAKQFPLNSMQAMALSGAKGSNVNVSQIMCLLGQQALEGRRVPVMVSGKTLPSFKPFETKARAGGYIAQRFFSGVRPQEYYFHCFATDHQVLTNRGFLFGDEIETALNAGEALTFASYDPKAEAFSYLPSTHFVRRPHNPAQESMVSVTYSAKSDQSNGVSLLVTSDHDLFAQFVDNEDSLNAGETTSPSKIKAGELLKLSTESKSRFKMLSYAKQGLTDVANTKANADAMAVFEKLELTTETQQLAFLHFYGYWLGNGTLNQEDVPAITCHSTKQTDSLFLRGLLVATGLKENVDFSEIVQEEGANITLSIVKPTWVNSFYSEYNPKSQVSISETVSTKSTKWFWSWTMGLGKMQLRSILGGLRVADKASKVESKDTRADCVEGEISSISTSSVLFRDQLIVTLMHAGYSAYFANQGPAGGEWAVFYTDSPSSAAPIMSHENIQEETKYTGDVWCVTVPPNGLIVTRRAEVDNNSVVTSASHPMIVGNCMAGREGLIDTAVKTSRSGYLQRCLIKQLEGVQISYDNTVRDSDGALIQFIYGGDAIDVTRESHLTNFKFCYDNYESLVAKHKPDNFDNIDLRSAKDYAKKALKHYKRHESDPHFEFVPKYDPVTTVYNPTRFLGSVSSVFQTQLEKFIEENPQLFDGDLTTKKFTSLMHLMYMQATVDPGEAVGIIASESIGEPSTQMTLNTFHFAGHGAANVTLGIPRMREIIMTAAEKIMTPQMTLPILDYITDDQADIFCKSVGRILLSEVVDKVSVNESSCVSSSGSINRRYTVRFQFYSKEEYETEYDITDSQVMNCISRSFLSSLESSIKKEFKKFGTSNVEVGEAVPANEAAMTYDDKYESQDAESDDDDADREDMKSKKSQAVSYDGPDDGEMEAMEKAGQSSEDEDVEMDSNSDSDSDSDEESDEDHALMSKGARERQNLIIDRHSNVSQFNFDDKKGEWCEFSLEYSANEPKILMVSLIEDICRKTVIREIPRIGRCLRPSPDQHGGQRVFVTEGVNFQAIWEEDSFINVNAVLSNDVAAVLKTYGVEAARNTIVREINNVFKTYAISVNERHLDLIADMMTRDGSYLAFNRFGMDSMTSPFLKMSFETTCNFLTQAVLDSSVDPLEYPSARIVVGKASKVGTGSFDVLTSLS